MLKKVVLGFLVFLTVVVLAVAVLTFNLDKILKPSLISPYQKKYVPDLVLDWSKIEIEVVNIGFFTKEIELKTDALCLDYKTSEFCHQLFLARVLFAPFDRPYFQFLKFVLKEQKNKINLADFKTEEVQPWKPIHSQIYEVFEMLQSNVAWAPQNFEISSAGVVSDGPVEKINYSADLSSQRIKLNLKMSDLILKFENKKDLDLSKGFKNQFAIKFSNESLDFDLLVDSSLQDEKLVFDFDLDAQLKDDRKIKIKTEFITELNSDELIVSSKKIKTDFKPYLESLSFKDCSLKLTSTSGENISLECLKNSFVVSSDNFKKKWSKNKIADLGHFYFMFKASIAEEVLLNLEEGVVGSVSYEFEEKKGAFYTFDSEAKIKLLKKKRKIVFEPETFDLDLVVFSYEKMVEQLAQSPFAVPAPFNAYRGEIKFETQDLLFDKKIQIPITASAKLKGDQDSEINFTADATLDLTENASGQYEPFLNMDVLFGENVLYLPDFDPLRGLPKMNSDPRIVYSQEKKSAFLNTSDKPAKKGRGFKYNINIKTQNSDSIKIKYKLLDPYLPLGVTAQLSHKGTVLNVFSKKTWAVEYLKRRVYISNMSISKKNISSENYYVDALMVYKASEYDIFIKAVGNIDSPAVTLRSDPPLSRSDIISVMLYNRTSKDIDRFQSESVGGAEAAFSDRALGLIGIWAFASTPIESVSYDSRSQTYRAQIGLPGGVKFDIGTDWERVQNLSLRKRISKYWMVVTSYQPGTDENEGIGDVLIQREWIF